jgi:putative endonuclease
MQPSVYILANQRNGTLYVGVTSDLSRRMSEHKAEIIEGFTKRYRLHTPVYAEFHTTIAEAILREKRVKNWRRAWKIMLIEQSNPACRDLSNEIG